MNGNGYLAKVCACALALSLLTGCGGSYGSQMDTKDVEEKLQGSLYESLSEAEQEYYAQLCTAVEKFEDEAIFTFKTPEERQEIMETFWCGALMAGGMPEGGRLLARDVMYEQAQYFWVDSNSMTYAVQDYPDDDRYLLVAKFSYLMDKETAMEEQERFENRVEEIVSQARAAGDTFDQIRYVHDYLCEHIVYDHELAQSEDLDSPLITAYGALMEGKTICSGYAMAFSLLLRELGYEVGVEFNNYGKLSLFDGHVWNYAKLDGEYYYFDVTWDDVDSENFDYTYQYFGITAQELKLTNYWKKDDAPVPDCTGTRYNYFVHQGYYIPEYSFEAVAASITRQLQEGSDRICLKFSDYGQLLSAEDDLFSQQRLYELISVDTVTYYIDGGTNLYLYIDC